MRLNLLSFFLFAFFSFDHALVLASHFFHDKWCISGCIVVLLFHGIYLRLNIELLNDFLFVLESRSVVKRNIVFVTIGLMLFDLAFT